MKTKQRLTREDWLLAGFRALAAKGPQALKAEPLARELNTTKGSFYWHFKDVPDFHQAMLTLWESRAFDDITDLLNTDEPAAMRLRKLGQISTTHHDDSYGGVDAEPALRAWARSDAQVAQAVARMDQRRMEYLHDLLGACDVSNPEITRFIYAATIGMEDLTTRDRQENGGAMGTLIDLVLALR